MFGLMINLIYIWKYENKVTNGIAPTSFWTNLMDMDHIFLTFKKDFKKLMPGLF